LSALLRVRLALCIQLYGFGLVTFVKHDKAIKLFRFVASTPLKIRKKGRKVLEMTKG
jgi:hypothetical protein